MSTRTMTGCAALLVLGLVSAFGAQADELRSATPAVRINYADLNLAKPGAVRELYSRLRSAARRVCGPVHRVELRQQLFSNECFAKALTDAVASVDHPALTALHEKRSDVKLAGGEAADNTRT